MATTVSPDRVQRRTTSDNNTPTKAEAATQTPAITVEDESLVDHVPVAAACCRLYSDSSNNTDTSLSFRCGAIVKKDYCENCRKKETAATEAAAKAEEERREEEACQHMKGKCDRCRESGTYLHFCECGGTFEAITVKDEDDNIECVNCESHNIVTSPKKRMLIKCTKCSKFKPCSCFGFRKVSEDVNVSIMVQFESPPAKRQKPVQAATRHIVANSNEEREFIRVPDEEEAAQLGLKPAVTVASSNSTTNSNHGITIYPSCFEFVSFLLPFLAICLLIRPADYPSWTRDSRPMRTVKFPPTSNSQVNRP